MRGGCGACGRSRKPLPGGFGHHVRRYYGRCAGCCRWTGTGAKRVTPPRAVSQETWPEVEKPRPRNLGQSRGGAPEGERADRKARAASERCGSSDCAFRRSASLRFIWRQQHSWRSCGKLGCGCIARTISLAPSAPAKRGRKTTGARAASEPWWRGAELRCRCRRITAVELLRFTRKQTSKLDVSARRQLSCSVEASAAPWRGRSRRRRRSRNFPAFLPVPYTR